MCLDYDTVACNPVAGRQRRYKQFYKSRYWVTASKINIFSCQQLNYNEESRFLCGPCLDVMRGTISGASSVELSEVMWSSWLES
jgi:hypothetical protein